jgi:hypothetical protein
MPPYEPVKSKSQSRALFAKARRGGISLEDAKGKTMAADFKRLPDRVRPSRRGKSGRAAKRAPRR